MTEALRVETSVDGERWVRMDGAVSIAAWHLLTVVGNQLEGSWIRLGYRVLDGEGRVLLLLAPMDQQIDTPAAFGERPKCAHCDAPATCLGSYEMAPWEFACSGCCGHGGEDGKCVRLEEIPELYRRKLEVERLELEAP